jgi:hypothetical protein
MGLVGSGILGVKFFVPLESAGADLFGSAPVGLHVGLDVSAWAARADVDAVLALVGGRSFCQRPGCRVKRRIMSLLLGKSLTQLSSLPQPPRFSGLSVTFATQTNYFVAGVPDP